MSCTVSEKKLNNRNKKSLGKSRKRFAGLDPYGVSKEIAAVSYCTKTAISGKGVAGTRVKQAMDDVSSGSR